MILFFLFLNLSFAEYRVFELVIRNTQDNSEKVVISTLDPLQYTDYYPVKSQEVVLYRETWMCYGSTANKKTCPNPRLDPSIEQARQPASQE